MSDKLPSNLTEIEMIQNLSETFKFLRKALFCCTQIEFGELLGLSQGFVSDVEAGRKIPGGKIIIAFRKLGISTEFLFTKKGAIQIPLPLNYQPKSTGERMRSIRERKKKTETQIAKSLEIAVNRLYEYENNRAKIQEEHLIQFSYKENIDLIWLSTGQWGKSKMTDEKS